MNCRILRFWRMQIPVALHLSGYTLRFSLSSCALLPTVTNRLWSNWTAIWKSIDNHHWDAYGQGGMFIVQTFFVRQEDQIEFQCFRKSDVCSRLPNHQPSNTHYGNLKKANTIKIHYWDTYGSRGRFMVYVFQTFFIQWRAIERCVVLADGRSGPSSH